MLLLIEPDWRGKEQGTVTWDMHAVNHAAAVDHYPQYNAGVGIGGAWATLVFGFLAQITIIRNVV